MQTSRSRDVTKAGFPPLLTVDEAGELLRIGRTKAYAMAREWRETGGRSGLPVIDLGHVLRVPRHALEEMIGDHLSSVPADGWVDESAAIVSPTERKPQPTADSTEVRRVTPANQQTRRRQNRISNQLDLFEPAPKPD